MAKVLATISLAAAIVAFFSCTQQPLPTQHRDGAILTDSYTSKALGAPTIATEIDSVYTIAVYEPFELDVDATDPDGDAVTYSLSEGPANASINDANGILEWTPQPGDSGRHDMTIVASDGTNNVSSSFKIYARYKELTETDPFAVLYPDVENICVRPGDTVTIKWYADLTWSGYERGVDISLADIVYGGEGVIIVGENDGLIDIGADEYVASSPNNSKLGIYKWIVPQTFDTPVGQLPAVNTKWGFRVNCIYCTPDPYRALADGSIEIKDNCSSTSVSNRYPDHLE
ncbi:MAG: hypothetical protein GF398_09885 [Chitinivibrionales bacterium]|nr:hypothetical protein [Chitinivibrionales bacterium]